jgi:ubiquinone/menaquinone biosynthesis C-methylase UbiE
MFNSDFDKKASGWDQNPMHIERAVAIAYALKEIIPLNKNMKALEYGAGTGLLSFLLRDEFREIVLMDSSREMIRICEEKSESFGTRHITPLLFDLEHDHYHEQFDIIYSQMVFHHITDTEAVIRKFHEMTYPGGYLVIADLYPEDGSFHGQDVIVHRGFDPAALSLELSTLGFVDATYQQCFMIRKENGREYPVFILKAVNCRK